MFVFLVKLREFLSVWKTSRSRRIYCEFCGEVMVWKKRKGVFKCSGCKRCAILLDREGCLKREFREEPRKFFGW